ncbi:MAG: hypothetical protein NUV81_01100, partial [bacterium]|nr:hypothetical protein [bacterium]
SDEARLFCHPRENGDPGSKSNSYLDKAHYYILDPRVKPEDDKCDQYSIFPSKVEQVQPTRNIFFASLL